MLQVHAAGDLRAVAHGSIGVSGRRGGPCERASYLSGSRSEVCGLLFAANVLSKRP
uniref:Uncharacterized protein n=1 Tax=Arundo donax TaxID=35708 RepID=A0A0A9HBQ3_ARUDO